MNKFKTLRVKTTQGHAGLLTRESQLIFNYATDDHSHELGLTMPLTARSYAANTLPGPLRQNLPEGFLKHQIAQQFGKTMKIDDFNVMAVLGRDMISRVQCSPRAPASMDY